MIPAEPDETAGGVAVNRITRMAVLSFPALARLGFPLDGGSVDREGRAVLAALALLGDRLAFARAGLHLRSGTDLVLESERVEWVSRGGKTEWVLDLDAARDLFVLAKERLADAGVEWDPNPVVLEPAQHLKQVIEQTFTEVSLEETEEE